MKDQRKNYRKRKRRRNYWKSWKNRRKFKKEKHKGEFAKVKKNVKNDVVKVKKNIKDVEELTLNKLRSDNVIKTKAKNQVKKILELESNDTDTDSTYSSSNTDTDSTCSSSNSSSSDSSSSCSSSDNSAKKIKKYKSKSKRKSGIYDKPSDEVVKKQLWPQSKLQYEYAGSKNSFEDLEFNLFVAGELEIISGNKISDKEKKGRIKLLKKISYFYELYEWKCIKKLYAHIIRQIENGLADWTHDFSEVETPLLIKYVKIEQRGKESDQKKIAKKDEHVFYCPFYQR